MVARGVRLISGQKRRDMARMVALDEGLVSRAASTPQDDTSATCVEDLFTSASAAACEGQVRVLDSMERSRGWHATADDHGFDLANNSGIAALGAGVSGQRRAFEKLPASWTPQGAKRAERQRSEVRAANAAVACKQDSFEDIALSVIVSARRRRSSLGPDVA